ncbi:hypothetical protein K440DRAFT_653695 [Wilcoxina mikolae CBS 423.85]|nr:hypothetical protein K440DRAFT_653695 [Wilcoxina mikolae CBS 423.85]
MDPESADTPTRSGTLKKKSSVKRVGSKRSRTGSIRSLKLEGELSRNSVFYSPVPTQSNPTEILVNRFQAWRKVLKDFISYFREVQVQYEARARGIQKLTQNLNSAVHPSEFVSSGGIMETNSVLRDFHKEATVNSEHAAKIELEVINHLNGLRSDLNLKIKEIKALSPDFKNNVDKEKEATKKEVLKLQEALESFDSNPSSGKDPYIIKLGLEKQLKRQIQEENYLHRAYLNLESSGRELEKIVVGEIQKAYGVYVKILARDGQELIDLADRLTASTLRLPPDYEWSAFVERDPHMVDPKVGLRNVEEIEYPGYNHPAVTEVRSGMLERKSKYLKSFTPAWYVLSSTHLHEFKSPDPTRDPVPVMSLYLPESSLGKHSDPAAVSHKFVLKAKQTGSLHRGHNWVFRAESHEAMLAWYESIKKLTEISGAERNAYVAQSRTSHQRSASACSRRAESYTSENGLDNDEADEVPYSGHASTLQNPDVHEEEPLQPPRRPEGGRFPSDIQVNRGLEHRESDSSASAAVVAVVLPGGLYCGDGYEERHDDGAYRDAHDTQPLEHSYVVVPPMNQHLRDSPSSWSSEEKHPVHEVHKNEPTYTHPTKYVPSYRGEPSTPVKKTRETGYGIDPITGEPEPQLEQINHSPQSSGPHIAFLGSDSIAARSDPESDPREPIPQEEADQVAIDSGSLDAVVAAPPPNSEDITQQSPLPLFVDDNPSVNAPAPVNDPIRTAPTEPVDYTVREADMPETLRDNSVDTISRDTISNLHVPGEYPKKV